MKIENHTSEAVPVAVAMGIDQRWRSRGWFSIDAFSHVDIDLPDGEVCYLRLGPVPQQVQLTSGHLDGDARKFRVAKDGPFDIELADQISSGWFASHPHERFVPVSRAGVAIFYGDFPRQLEGLKLRARDVQIANHHVHSVVMQPSFWQRINPFFWWAQRRFRALREVLLEVERYRSVVQNVETALELQQVGHDVPMNEPLLFRTLYQIRQRLVMALKTDQVLRNNPGYGTHPGTGQLLRSVQPTEAQRLLTDARSHAALYQEALELSLRVGAELSAFDDL